MGYLETVAINYTERTRSTGKVLVGSTVRD